MYFATIIIEALKPLPRGNPKGDQKGDPKVTPKGGQKGVPKMAPKRAPEMATKSGPGNGADPDPHFGHPRRAARASSIIRGAGGQPRRRVGERIYARLNMYK